MKEISIIEYQSEYFRAWNDFVSEAKNATFLFHREFMEYHSDRFQDASLLIFSGKNIVGVLPANKKGGDIYSHSGLSYGGFIVNRSMKFQSFIKCFKQILVHLNASGFKTLNFKLLPSIYAVQPNHEIDFILNALNAKLVKRHMLSVIDLNENFRINNNRFEGKKRGEKHNLEIREEPNFKEYWQLILEPNLRLKHQVSPVHTLAEIEFLYSKFPKNIRQFNVYHQNNIVAGTTIFESQNVAHAQYISGNAENNQLGSLDYLYCYLIEKVFRNKKYFDFGTSNENEGKNINKGLLYWKEGFGARSYNQDFYTVQVDQHRNLETIFL